MPADRAAQVFSSLVSGFAAGRRCQFGAKPQSRHRDHDAPVASAQTPLAVERGPPRLVFLSCAAISLGHPIFWGAILAQSMNGLNIGGVQLSWLFTYQIITSHSPSAPSKRATITMRKPPASASV